MLAMALLLLTSCGTAHPSTVAPTLSTAPAQAVYDFWYKDLCDVYLEAIKPVMQLDASTPLNVKRKHATQTVLHCCIHNGLRLLHPFMPFVTEELYQRLQLLCHQVNPNPHPNPNPNPNPHPNPHPHPHPNPKPNPNP